MTILQYIKADAQKIPKTFGYKLRRNILTIKDQEEALINPYWAYMFVRCVSDADIRKCEDAACKDPRCAYLFAQDIVGADISKCEKAACKDSYYELLFYAIVVSRQRIRSEFSSIIDELFTK